MPMQHKPPLIPMNIRCMQTEKDAWFAAAKRQRLSFSEWARMTLDNAAGFDPYPILDDDEA